MLYSALYNLFWFVLILSFIVFIHELGHYICARIFGVKIETFSIGFGKEVYGITDKRGTRWKFSMIPAGGYVKMFGDTDPSSATVNTKIPKAKRHLAFSYKPLWQKSLIAFAGPLANYILALAIFFVIFFFVGKVVVEPVIEGVQAQSPAALAGLESNDRITAINGSNIEGFEEVRRHIMINTDPEITISVTRGGDLIDLKTRPIMKKMTNAFGDEFEAPFIGVSFKQARIKEYGFFSALHASYRETISMTEMMLKGLYQIISGSRSLDDISGPVKIAHYSGKTASFGPIAILMFMAMISLNLGLVNLLPIPMLDGGHIMFCTVEAVFGSKFSQKFQKIGTSIGFAFLVTLTIFVIYKDIAEILS